MDNNEDKLGVLAAHINDNHGKYNHGSRALLPYALTAGIALAEAKGLVGHGHWYEWLKHNFDGSKRTAQKYMRIARRWADLQQILADNAIIGVDEALVELKETREPEIVPGPSHRTPVPPRTRKSFEAVLTPGEESRDELLKWFRSELDELEPEQVVYLAQHGLPSLRESWDQLLLELGPLPFVLVPALARRDKALSELGLGEIVDEDKDVSDNGPRYAQINANFKTELIDGLHAQVEKLSEDQRALVAHHLGIRNYDDHEMPIRSKIRRRLEEAISPLERDPPQLWHVANLLNPRQEDDFLRLHAEG